MTRQREPIYKLWNQVPVLWLITLYCSHGVQLIIVLLITQSWIDSIRVFQNKPKSLYLPGLLMNWFMIWTSLSCNIWRFNWPSKIHHIIAFSASEWCTYDQAVQWNILIEAFSLCDHILCLFLLYVKLPCRIVVCV